jgi:hypothetical protein
MPRAHTVDSADADVMYRFDSCLRHPKALSKLVCSVLQKGDQVNKGLSACQLLHRNHENGRAHAAI